MAIQTEYNERMSPPSPGTLNGGNWDADTGIVETADGIGFGLAVGQGVSDKGIVLGGAIGDFRGVTVKDITLVTPSAGGGTVDKYAEGKNAGVITRGKVWVEPFEAVAAGDVVHYNATTGRLGKAGGSGPIPGARWVTTAAADGRALVELAGVSKNGISAT